MTTVTAPDEVHDSVALPPTGITDGVTVALTVGGDATFTRTCAVDVPLGPVAVSVYVVDVDGETDTDPLVGFAPIPLSIVTEVAFVVDQLSVDDWPAVIVCGDAVKVMPGP